MKGIRVASRYAKSLLDISIEFQKHNEIYRDVELILKTIHSAHDLSLLLKSPIVKSDIKITVFHKLFSSVINSITLSFINIIIKKHRENILEDIASEFIRQYKKHMRINTLHVASAIKLDAAANSKIIKSFKSVYDGEVEMIEKTDPKLIGGFVLRFEDLEYNASIRNRLNEFKKEFDKNPYIKDF